MIGRVGLTLRAWRPHTSGALRGYATLAVAISPVGDAIVFHDCPAYRRADGSAFVALPNKPKLDHDGRHARDAAGKPAYAILAEFSRRALQDRFSAAAVALIEAAHPETFQ